MELKDIKAVIDLMKKNAISEFELEKQDFKIRLKRSIGAAVATDDSAAMAASLMTNAPAVQSSQPTLTIAPPPANNAVEIKAPMIGTFYRAPSPESAHYVETGSEVHPDTVVCIIEAMKVMNEIKAEVRGIVTEVLVDNAKPVEFGQPMFRVRPS